jgi:putative serine protease PepD
MKSTITKVGIGFLLGATMVGGIATAATNSTPSLKACVDNRTQALYLSKDGTCSKTRTLVELSSGGLDAKSVAAAVTPSVVSIQVSAAAGSGTGSGSVYKTSATSSYIITNNHVVEDAATSGKITVELLNGDLIDAKIVGRDSNYDLAVIQVQRGNLPVIAIGDSSKISVGDPVIAIGSPLGLASTVTSGIISALNRPVTAGTVGAESYVNAIQTDASINPGNSGGALVDAQGRIIGVNSAIATLSSGGTTGSIGLGFSIPFNEAKRVIDEIIATGKSTRPVLGVNLDATYAGVGAKILKLVPDGGAEKAGIPEGSVIRSIDAPGAVVTVLVDLPTGGQKSFKVTLGSTPSS